ncbi:hypothetical protein ACU4GD_31080 [Cupriavidus basilensis]
MRRDEQGLLDYMKSQPNRAPTLAGGSGGPTARSIRCSAVTMPSTAAAAAADLRIDQEDPKEAGSGMTAPRATTLPASLFDNAGRRAARCSPADILFGMGMSYNGYLVVNTLRAARLITLNRDTLEVVDVFTVAGKDELFMNSFAAGPEANGGAVYVASNTTRCTAWWWTRTGKIRSDDASGAWQASYDRGVRMPAPKIGDGTGSTPTLMGFRPE